MTLLRLAEIVFFLLYGVVGMGWVNLHTRILAVTALVVAFLLIFTGIGDYRVWG